MREKETAESSVVVVEERGKLRSIGTEHKYTGRTSHINVVGIALHQQRTLKGLLQVIP